MTWWGLVESLGVVQGSRGCSEMMRSLRSDEEDFCNLRTLEPDTQGSVTNQAGVVTAACSCGRGRRGAGQGGREI